MKSTKTVFLLGSTGSIGVNTLDCIGYLNRENKAEPFRVVGLAARENHRRLERQIKAFSPRVVYIRSEEGYRSLRNRFPKVSIYTGEEGIKEAMNRVSFSLCVNGLVGSAGMAPTLEAIGQGADIALANKETLIMAGDIIIRKIKKKKVKLIPVDSEHAAIFHLLRGIRKEEVENIVLTASGGPFFFKDIDNPSIEDTLAHPTWKMGPKITVDSATMMNKGLEVIEAHYLFDIPFNRIRTVVHPQSMVHSMVETVDGEIYAQIGPNDMRHPIQNALTHPRVVENSLKRLKLWEIGELSFFKPDHRKFPLLKFAYTCGERGGTALAALNAANEGAVNLFLQGKITYKDIYRKVRKEVERHPFRKMPSVSYILDLDREIKERMKKEVRS